MTTGVSTVDNGEIDYEEMPDLVYDTSEETLESEWFKLQFLSRNDYSRAPSGPFKEEPIGDSSETMFTLQMLAGQDGLDESCVTQHTKHAEYKAGTQTGETVGFQQGQEQENQDHNLWRQTKSIEAKNHSYRHGRQRTSSTSQQSSSVSRLAGV